MEFPFIDALGESIAFSVMCEKDYEFSNASHIGAHSHPHGELFLIRSGHLKSYTYKRRWLIPAGHLCWVPPHTVHGGDTDDSLGIRMHLRAEYCVGLPPKPCVVSGTALIEAIVERLRASGDYQPALSEPQMRLFSVLKDEVERAITSPIVLPMPQDGKLRKITERWLECPEDRTDIDQLAEEVGMSRRTFTRNFKLSTGLSVGDWRQIAKLMQGIDMLAEGKSVTDTAFALGFDSVSSFVALCRRHTGMSPKSMVRNVMPDKGEHRARGSARHLIPYS